MHQTPDREGILNHPTKSAHAIFPPLLGFAFARQLSQCSGATTLSTLILHNVASYVSVEHNAIQDGTVMVALV